MSFFKSIKSKIEETLNHTPTQQSSTNQSPQFSNKLSNSSPNIYPSTTTSNNSNNNNSNYTFKYVYDNPQDFNVNNNNNNKYITTTTTATTIQSQPEEFENLEDNLDTTLIPTLNSLKINDKSDNHDNDDDNEENSDHIINIWGTLKNRDKQITSILFSELYNRQKIVFISTGATHSSIITDTGNFYTFGDGNLGKLGHGNQESYDHPKLVEFFSNSKRSLRVISVANGGKHTVVLTLGGGVYSFGSNDSLQMGLGSNFSSSFYSTPQLITALTISSLKHDRVIKLSCGTNRSAAITMNGSLYTWGRNESGRLGLGSSINSSGGANNTSSSTTATESNISMMNQSTPKLVQSLTGHTIVDMSSGGGHSLVLTSKGLVFTFGLNIQGQLGHGCFSSHQSTPKQIQAFQGMKIVKISAGGYHSIAITDNGDVYAFGRSDYGVLGTIDQVGDRNTPVLINNHNDGVTFIDVSSGFQHNVAVSTTNQLYSWGCSAGGRLIQYQQNKPIEENQLIPRKCISNNPILFTCGEIVTMVIEKRLINNKPTSPVINNTTIDTTNVTTSTTVTTDKNDVDIVKTELKRPSSPTPSFLSLARESTGKELLNNTQSNFIEWMASISKAKLILTTIQMKTNVSSSQFTNLGLSIEKKTKDFDDTIRQLKSFITLNTANSSTIITESIQCEIDKLVSTRTELGNQLINEYKLSIDYWNEISNQKQSILNKLISTGISSNSGNGGYDGNTDLSLNEIQNSSFYLINKMDQALNNFCTNIIITGNNMDSTNDLIRLSMEEIQLLILETFKFGSKYLKLFEISLVQCNQLISIHRGKFIEIETILSKTAQAQQMLEQREKIKSEFRSCKRNSIEISKKIEVLELDDQDNGLSNSFNSNNDRQFTNLKNELSLLKREEQKLSNQQIEINESLIELFEKYVPEYKVKLRISDKISNRIKDTGLLLLDRKFNNYDIIKTLATHPHNVYLASFNDQLVVLKEFGIGDQFGKQMFERQVSLMKQMSHKCIMTIQAVFYDRNAFIQMEYIDGGNLFDWLNKKQQSIKPWEIQKIFQQIIQGISYMHSLCIIHRDLKFENILIRESDSTPIISDFDLVKDISSGNNSGNNNNNNNSSGIGGNGGNNSTTFNIGSGTELYKAPEMKEQGVIGNYSTDIWAFGVMLYKACQYLQPSRNSYREPFLLPEETGLPIPFNFDTRLNSLLSSILIRNSKIRPSAHSIAVHPYFVTSLVEDLVLSRTLIDSREKIAAFRSHVSSLSDMAEEMSESIQLSLRRDHLVLDLFSFFQSRKIEPTKLFSRLEISFKGEKGMDLGGLSSEMYSLLYNDNQIIISDNQDNPQQQQLINNNNSIFSKKFNLFENSDTNSSFYLLNSQDLFNDQFDNPLSVIVGNNLKSESTIYKLLGIIFIKSVIDGKPIPDSFPPSFFKYLLGIKPSIEDLEIYDPQLAQSFKKVLILDNIDEYLSTTFEGLVDGGENIPVTDLNKQEFIQRNIDRVLVGSRQSKLDAFKSGFMCIESLNAHFALFSPTELQLLMCGNTLVDSNVLKKNFKFIGFDSATSSTVDDFCRAVDEMSQDELHLFLRFLTGMVVLPLSGFEKPLSIIRVAKSDKLPTAHTCSFQLDLPDYQDFIVLKKKLLQMLEWVDGFAFI